MIESPLFSSFGQKYYGVCNLKGQSMQHQNSHWSKSVSTAVSAGHHKHQHCMYITEECQ